MRRIGSVPSVELAKRFERFLSGLEIVHRIDCQPSQCEIWIVDEGQVSRAKTLLDGFLKDPQSPEFDAVVPPPKQKSVRAVERPIREPGPRRGTIPLTKTLIAISIAVALFTDFGRRRQDLVLKWMMTDAVWTQAEVWRLFTPMFLHFSMMHLFFNMSATYALSGVIEKAKGTSTLALLVFPIAAISNYAQFATHGSLFGGMSGVVYGLFGYVWVRSRLFPWDGFYISQESVYIMLGWLFLCLTGFLGNIANTAHFVGLGIGVLLAAAPKFNSSR